MRDKERIPIILNELSILWQSNPDLRFFQLVEAVAHHWGDLPKDPFYVEDDKLLSILKQCNTKNYEL